MNIKEKRKALYTHLKPELEKKITNKQVNELDLFHSPEGLRLTYIGYSILQKEYTCQSFPLQYPLVPIEYLKLEKFLKMPYFLGKTEIKLFDSGNIFIIKLSGKTIHEWLASKKL